MNLRSDVAIERISAALRRSWLKEAIDVNDELGLGCDIELPEFKEMAEVDKEFYRNHARVVIEEVINMLSEED
jgi:hypothetical protein